MQKLKELGTQLSDIGILVNTRASVDRIRDTLGASGLQAVALQPNKENNRNIPGVRITTMHRAKGLEFFAVAILFLNESSFPPAGAIKSAVDQTDLNDIKDQYKSLLHVVATRAKKALYVSWSGTPSKLIKS